MNEASKDNPLAGKGIVVTRPAHQAAPLAALIRAAGGTALRFPVIEIVDIEDPRPLYALIDRLDAFEWAIFISPNAANKALAAITARRGWPPRLAVAAVGRASVRELNNFGVMEVLAPARFDSEGLLETPPLKNIAGKHVAIFRGVGGREMLGNALTARGAIVEYAECYRRVRPRVDPASLLEAWARDELHAITVTSSEGLRNFCELVGPRGRPWMLKTPVFAPHPRIAATARELDFATVVETAQGDDGLMQGLREWFGARV